MSNNVQSLYINSDSQGNAEENAVASNSMANSTDNRLKSFIERIERLNEEKSDLMEDIKLVFGEAKSHGYDPKIMRTVIKIRKMEPEKRDEQNALVDTYLSALGTA